MASFLQDTFITGLPTDARLETRMHYLDRLAEAEDGDGWALSLLRLGIVQVTTGKLSISDPSGDVPKSLELGEGEYPVTIVLIAPEQRRTPQQVAAVMVEVAPGRPTEWAEAGAVSLQELICVCDADLRYRMEEWVEDGRYQQSFYEDIAIPALSERGRLRLGAPARFEDQRMVLVQNSNSPGGYTVWKGLDPSGAVLCYLLDLGMLVEG